MLVLKFFEYTQIPFALFPLESDVKIKTNEPWNVISNNVAVWQV